MKKLILIDGNAILHRAFHAIPPLNNDKGLPTNAVYGFFSMLFKIIEDLKPENIIVCFDRPKPTFRKQLYVGYQAKRPALSEDLSPQFDLVYKALDKAKIEHYGIDGYEADDLIGTLSVEGANKGYEVIIVSGDRDLLQLVNKHVLMLAPIVGISNMTLFDEAKVKDKYGLRPHQIIDYKALVGDASDNYPGVSGIGPKTASNLIQKYGSLEGIYEHIKEVPENLSLKLATDSEQAALAKKLATIIKDVPLKFDEEKSGFLNFDSKGLEDILSSYGFNNILKRIPKVKTETKEKEKQDKDQMSLL